MKLYVDKEAKSKAQPQIRLGDFIYDKGHQVMYVVGSDGRNIIMTSLGNGVQYNEKWLTTNKMWVALAKKKEDFVLLASKDWEFEMKAVEK